MYTYVFNGCETRSLCEIHLAIVLTTKLGLLNDLYVVTCYFPPSTSIFADLGDNAFEDLSDDITRFSTRGFILLTGDFNAHIVAL